LRAAGEAHYHAARTRMTSAPISTAGSARSSSPSSSRAAGSSPTTSTWATGRPSASCACGTTGASRSCTSGRYPPAPDQSAVVVDRFVTSVPARC